MSRLVTRLLELARADVMQPEPGGQSDLVGFLRALVDVYEDHGQAIDVTGLEAMDELKVVIVADNLASIVRNLIDNAVQHARATPRLSIHGTPDSAVLVFSDDGPGISTANASRIFDPFFTTDRETGGTGLGLSLVKTLVEVHGGTIQLSQHTGGCEFVVTLPRAFD